MDSKSNYKKGWFICEECKKEFYGQRNKKKVFCSKACFYKFDSRMKKGIRPPKLRLPENYVPYNKGKGKNPVCIKNTAEYKRWRTAVFERDNYTCQDCGQRGGILNADHVKPQSLYPELRFVLSNGRTLCRDCHKKTPTWGICIYNLKRMFNRL